MPNSRRKCAWKPCGQRQPAETMIVKGPLAWCDSDHQYNHALEALGKLRKQKDRQAKESHRKRKAEFYGNDIARQKALTQAACNKLVSLLDRGYPCMACGRDLRGGRYQHSSHLKSVGSNSFLRYDPRNIHLCCVPCNQWLSGNVAHYRAGLSLRYGQAMLDYLDTAPRSKEWSCEELAQMRKDFSAEIRRLERGEQPSRDWRKIPA